MKIENFYNFYVNRLGTSVALTTEREKELALIIQANKNKKMVERAVEEFVLANLKLVVSEAFKYAKKCGQYMQDAGFDVSDLVSAGHLGLMKAVYKFDPTFNTKFSTYAVNWIRQPIRKFIYESSSISIPSYIMTDSIKHKKIEEEFGEISDEELMDKLQISKKNLSNLKMARHSKIHLDAPIAHDGEGDMDYLDILADEDAEDPSEVFERNNNIELMMKFVDELTEMERDIICCQCLVDKDDKINLSELGKKWNITGERIRQIKNEALAKLKRKMTKAGVEYCE